MPSVFVGNRLKQITYLRCEGENLIVLCDNTLIFVDAYGPAVQSLIHNQQPLKNSEGNELSVHGCKVFLVAAPLQDVLSYLEVTSGFITSESLSAREDLEKIAGTLRITTTFNITIPQEVVNVLHKAFPPTLQGYLAKPKMPFDVNLAIAAFPLVVSNGLWELIPAIVLDVTGGQESIQKIMCGVEWAGAKRKLSEVEQCSILQGVQAVARIRGVVTQEIWDEIASQFRGDGCNA